MLADLISRHYANPQGILGHVAGLRMARQHRPETWWTVAVLDARAGEHILEVGFGPGVAIQQVAKAVRHGRVVGVDCSATMLAAARRRNARAIRAGRVELRLANASTLPFDDLAFDKAYSIHSIYFWEQPLHALRELWRVLRPGGLLVMTVLPSECWPAERVPGTQPYTGDQLLQLLEVTGFVDLRVLADANNPHYQSNYSVLGRKRLL